MCVHFLLVGRTACEGDMHGSQPPRLRSGGQEAAGGDKDANGAVNREGTTLYLLLD